MKLNTPTKPAFNHEGVRVTHITPHQALRRSVMSCMLWEDEFYEAGTEIAKRIADLVRITDPAIVSQLAIEAREQMKLRHAPLLLVRELARNGRAVAAVLERVIQRPDELSEFLAIYWKDGKRPLSAQVRKGLALAFGKFNEYQLAKYNRDGAIKLRDVMRLCHPVPRDEAQAALWKALLENRLATPDTWEVAISAAKGATAEEKQATKRTEWTRLLEEKKLGALALLRNLRNMEQAGVSSPLIRQSLLGLNPERVLPFRFIAAARHAPRFEPELEQAMFKCLAGRERLAGKTVLLVDTSPSMEAKVSGKSELTRHDAALGLAILLRELCEEIEIVAFSSESAMVPPRRGFALGDAIRGAVPSNGTLLGRAVNSVAGRYDRLIVITDEQSQDAVPNPTVGKEAYMVNVASAKNGVGYGAWHHIDGWSEAIVDYIQAFIRD